MPDLEIQCLQCREAFVFSEKDQDYVYRRNLAQPQRCEKCRPSRKKAASSDKSNDAKPRYEITCDRCGKIDFVPFEPKIGRSVMCKDCHGATQTSRTRNV